MYCFRYRLPITENDGIDFQRVFVFTYLFWGTGWCNIRPGMGTQGDGHLTTTTHTFSIVRLSICETKKGAFSKCASKGRAKIVAHGIGLLLQHGQSWVCPRSAPKGVDPDGYIVEQIGDVILWLGHPTLIRNDNRPAFLQAVDTALAALKAKGLTVNAEGSVPYGPKTKWRSRKSLRVSFEIQLKDA